MGGGGRHKSCNASLSQPYVQWSGKQQSPCEGGGGFKFGKKCKKNNEVHIKENIGHRFPCILYFFIHPQPNNIGPARQNLGTGALFLISLSLGGGGRGGTAITY